MLAPHCALNTQTEPGTEQVLSRPGEWRCPGVASTFPAPTPAARGPSSRITQSARDPITEAGSPPPQKMRCYPSSPVLRQLMPRSFPENSHRRKEIQTPTQATALPFLLPVLPGPSPGAPEGSPCGKVTSPRGGPFQPRVSLSQSFRVRTESIHREG